MMRYPHDTHGTNIWLGPGVDVDVKNDAELGRVGKTQAGVRKNMAGLGESSSRGIIRNQSSLFNVSTPLVHVSSLADDQSFSVGENKWDVRCDRGLGRSVLPDDEIIEHGARATTVCGL
jgi:hypothetical protein